MLAAGAAQVTKILPKARFDFRLRAKLAAARAAREAASLGAPSRRIDAAADVLILGIPPRPKVPRRRSRAGAASASSGHRVLQGGTVTPAAESVYMEIVQGPDFAPTSRLQ